MANRACGIAILCTLESNAILLFFKRQVDLIRSFLQLQRIKLLAMTNGDISDSRWDDA
jgi:hypothetical protein